MLIFLGSALKSSSRCKIEAVILIKKFHHRSFIDKHRLFRDLSASFCLGALGDFLEQHIEVYFKELDKWHRRRTMHMAVSGMTVGLICHFWYKLLDTRIPGRSLQIVFKKIILDQTICSPILIAAFFLTMGIMEKKSRQEVWEEVKQKAWKLYAAEWMVWPLAQFVNFSFIPLKYRVLYDNTISLCYDMYTSKVKHE